MVRELALLIMLAVEISSFYIYLTPSSPQCFYNSLQKEQRLLIEVQTPIVSLLHKIIIKVTHNNTTLLHQDIVNQVKLTVPRPTNVITDKAGTDALEYQTCFWIAKDPEAPRNDSDNPAVTKAGYLVHLKIFTNFEHKIQEKKQQSESPSALNYKELTKLAKRLKDINTEQISLHQINEVKEKLSQFYLQTLKSKIIAYSVLQIAIVMLFTCLQVRMLRGYLNNISVI